MTLDGGWGLIISGVLTLILGGVGVLVWRHVDSAQADAKKALEANVNLQSEFQRYQTHVAENYVRTPALERIEKKLDRLLERGSPHEQL